jgi:hypothetical protein
MMTLKTPEIIDFEYNSVENITFLCAKEAADMLSPVSIATLIPNC